MLPCHVAGGYRHRWLWFTCALLCHLAGCEQSAVPDTHMCGDSTSICKALQQALPEAASMSPAEFERWLKANEPPPLHSFDNQPLSLLLLYADPYALDFGGGALHEFSMGRYLDPQQWAAIYQESLPQGFYSALHPRRLIQFDCEVAGQRATGIATYDLGKRVHLALQFTAEMQGDQWIFQQLELPDWGLRTVRQPDGRWHAPSGVPQRPPVQLVQIEPPRRWRDASMIRYLVWAGIVDGKPTAWISGQRYTVPTELHTADSPLKPIIEALYALRENEPQPVGHSVYVRLVLRIDQDFPCGALRSLLVAASEAGLQHISLGAEVASGDEPQPARFGPWPDPVVQYTEYPFDAENAGGGPPVERLPMYVELRADEQGGLAQRLVDRKTIADDEALLAAVESQLAAEADETPPREIRVHFDDRLRYGELLPVLAALSRRLERFTAGTRQDSPRLHRIEIVADAVRPY